LNGINNMDKSNPESSQRGIRPGVILAVVVVVGVLVAGKFAGWFGGRTQSEAVAGKTGPEVQSAEPRTAPVAGTRPPPGLRSPTPLAAGANGAAPGSASASVRPGAVSPSSPPGASTPGAAAAVPDAATEMADWNDKLDNILGSNEDEAKKAEQLLAMWSTLPEDGQVETMQHITNLLPDEKFSQIAQTLTNTHTVEAVMDIIMGDALNRPNSIKLPSLLEVARIPGHPKAEEALDILEVFVDHNYGTDWAQWDKAVKDWLKENPDEPEDEK